jgi:RHS repeat-associated protein
VVEYVYAAGGEALSDPLVTLTYNYATSGWTDKLTSIEKQQPQYTSSGSGVSTSTTYFDYDDYGNPIKYRVTSPTTAANNTTWTRGRLLASYNGYNNIYDADGVRYRRQSADGTTQFIYSGSQLQGERTGANYSSYVYDQTGIRGLIYNDVAYSFEKNVLGDIIAIYDGSGDKVATYAYDAWGNCKVMDGDGDEVTSATHIGNINPFRYRSYYWDAKLQMYYLQTRFYDPQLRRFINADSTDYLDPTTPGGLNLFAYCNNNPVEKRNVAVGNTIFAVKNNGIIGDTTKIAGKKNDFVFANHVLRGHHSTSRVENALLGTLFGNVTFTTTRSDRDPGLFYSFTDQGIDDVTYGVGYNIGGWFGQELYVSTTGNIGVGVQLTPWFHFNSELGKNGLSLGFGIDNGLVSNDVMVNIGWGTIAGVVVIAVLAPALLAFLAGLAPFVPFLPGVPAF